jgi:basic membrane protein A
VFLGGCQASSEKNDAASKLKVGLVLDVGGRGDKAFNDMANAGLINAQKEYPAQIEVKCVEPKNSSERETLLRNLAADKYDLVMGLGQYFTEPLKKVAGEFPHTEFVLIDAFIPGLDETSNIYCVTFRSNEGAFMAGAAAALKSQSGVVGFVGGNEQLANNFLEGYKAGATYINKDIKVLADYVGTGLEGFRQPDKARTIALHQIDQGADVIFHAAGQSGYGVNEAAAARKKLAIGEDIDQTFTVPPEQQFYILTSVVKGIDQAVQQSIKLMVENKMTGGSAVVWA